MRLPSVGDVFEDRYELVALLGEGGFASVYRAQDRLMHRDVALKLLRPRDDSRAANARFMREARVLAGLQHPNIVTLFEFGQTTEGLQFMVFEYVAGRDLKTLLTGGALPIPLVIHILRQLLDALREAHTHGVLHRDIKPANVLIHAYGGDDNRLKLLDFGVAKPLRDVQDRLTKTGAVVGTLRYMAPEQLAGEPVDARTDIFAVGLVAHEMITGQPAIRGRSQKTMIVEQLSLDPIVVPPSQAPLPLRNVLNRATAREPAARWPSAQAMREALIAAHAAIESGEPQIEAEHTTAVRTGAAASNPAPAGPRRDKLAVFAMLAGILIGVAAVYLALSWKRDPEPPPPPAPRAQVRVVAEPDVDVRKPDANTTSTALAGCVAPPQDFNGTLPLDWPGGPVDVHIPKGYDASERLPVMILLHRVLSTGETFLTLSGMREIADEHRFFVLAPTSTSEFGWAPERVSLIADMLDEAQQYLCIDPHWLYVLGDENAGSFGREIACKMPVSGLATTMDMSGLACRPVAPTARMRVYGRADKNVPLRGGTGCNPLQGVSQSLARINKEWTQALDCSPEPIPWQASLKGGTCERWDCEHGTFASCATDGGHEWPGGNSLLPGCATSAPAVEFPFGRAIWTFFAQHGARLDGRSQR